MKNIRTVVAAFIALTSVIEMNAQLVKADNRFLSMTGAATCTANSCGLNNTESPVNKSEAINTNPQQTNNDSVAVTTKLPVAITGFSGISSNKNVILTWVAEEGFIASKFIIEKSNDGNNWQVMGAVAANTNSNVANVYYYGDAKPFNNTYYRLKPVENGSEGNYTATVNVKNNSRKRK